MVPQIVEGSGKQELGGGVLVGITIKLLNWRLKFADRGAPPWILCSVSGGNLVAVDENGASMNPIAPAAYVTVIITNSSSATITELTAIQHSSFNNGVTIDVVNGTSGTTFPTGTGEQPVDNLTDAKAIAVSRGFTNLYIVGDITLVGISVAGYAIYGRSTHTTTITVQSGSTVDTEFYDANVVGTLNGEVHLKGCEIGGNGGLLGFQGHAHECMLVGDITLAGTDTVHIINCHSGVPGNATPKINMNGDGPGLGVRSYAGGILLKNKSGNDSVSLDFISGQLILEDTVTNGTIVVRGVAKITDGSTGSAVVDMTNLVNPSTVANQTWEEAMSDHVNSGTFGLTQDLLLAVAQNRYKIDTGTNVMTIYDEDGSSPLLQFTMKDASGIPSTNPMYERDPV